MNKRGFVFCFVIFSAVLFSFSFVLGEIRINEVMYNPNFSNDYNEYIEIYNNGSTEINLIGWKLCNNEILSGYVNREGFTNLNTTLILQPNFSAIISDGGSSGTEVYSNFNVSENSIALHINGTAMCTRGLNNTGEEITLWNSSNYLMVSINYSSSWGANGDGKSLQYYDNSWQSCTPTPGQSNNCTTIQQENICNDTCSSLNYQCGTYTICNASVICGSCNSGYACQSGQCIEDDDIYIELNWDEEDIINGDEFEITVKAYNLEEKDYDVLVEIKDDDGKIISERYGKYGTNKSNVWKSSTFYALKFVSGNGNDFEDMKLKIDSDYSDFSGDATIIARIRENEKTGVIDELDEDIEVLETEENFSSNNFSNSNSSTSSNPSSSNSSKNQSITGSVIRLGSKTLKGTGETEDIKTEKSTVYKSKNEHIKEYAIYGFAIFCVFLIVLLLIDKK